MERLYAALIVATRVKRCPDCGAVMQLQGQVWVCPNGHRWIEVSAAAVGQGDWEVDPEVWQVFRASTRPPGFKPKGGSKSGRRRKRPGKALRQAVWQVT